MNEILKKIDEEIEKAIEIMKETLKMQKSALGGLPTNYQPVAKINEDIKATELSIKALEAQQADRWISVTDRLPNRAGTYLGTVKFNDDSIGVFPVWWHNGIRTDISWEMDKCNVNVIAWKPLPEPYKEEAYA